MDTDLRKYERLLERSADARTLQHVHEHISKLLLGRLGYKWYRTYSEGYAGQKIYSKIHAMKLGHGFFCGQYSNTLDYNLEECETPTQQDALSDTFNKDRDYCKGCLSKVFPFHRKGKVIVFEDTFVWT